MKSEIGMSDVVRLCVDQRVKSQGRRWSSLVDGGWNGGSIDGGKSCRSDERECGGGGFRNSIFRVC